MSVPARAGRRRRARLAFVILLVVGGFGALHLPADRAAGERGPGTFRVATANLHRANSDPAAVRGVAAARPDVLVLLEYTGANADTVALGAAGLRPVALHPAPGPGGIGVWVRMGQGVEVGLVAEPLAARCAFPVVALRVGTGRGAFGLLAVHAPPPLPACPGGNLSALHTLADWVHEGRASRPLGPIPAGLPLVVAGDLNAFPFSARTKRLRERGLRDAVADARRFPPTTWRPHPKAPPLARIDYVLAATERWSADAAWALAVPGSDHRAVVADLRAR